MLTCYTNEFPHIFLIIFDPSFLSFLQVRIYTHSPLSSLKLHIIDDCLPLFYI